LSQCEVFHLGSNTPAGGVLTTIAGVLRYVASAPSSGASMAPEAALGVRFAVDPSGADGAVVAQHDGGENLLPDVFGAAGGLLNRKSGF
jgi:hypothetical protein